MTSFSPKDILYDSLQTALEGGSAEIDPARPSSQRPDPLSKLEALGLFIGTVSHSIKGLCTGLDGGIYLFNSGEASGDDARRRRGFAMIQRNANRLRRLVNNTLYYGKERPLELAAVSMEEIHAGVAEILGNKARRLGICFEVAIEGAVGEFIADSSAMTAALVNLVENALDACAADTGKTDHSVSLLSKQTADGIRIQIRDNGIGMDLTTQNSAAELFFSSKGSSGTGLGLFIAEQIVVNHGGKMAIQSRLGEGTGITITLPRDVYEKMDEKRGVL